LIMKNFVVSYWVLVSYSFLDVTPSELWSDWDFWLRLFLLGGLETSELPSSKRLWRWCHCYICMTEGWMHIHTYMFVGRLQVPKTHEFSRCSFGNVPRLCCT
jgi:hypothetical protein